MQPQVSPTGWLRFAPWLIGLVYLLSLLPWAASMGLLILSVTPEMEPLLFGLTCSYPLLLLGCGGAALFFRRQQKRKAARWLAALPFFHLLGLLIYYVPFFIPGLGG